jgi:hypothetical protein
MHKKSISSKLLLCLVLLSICQFSVLMVPVNGLAWEITTWVSDGGQYSRGSYLDPGDRWYVKWDVLQGSSIDVSFENASSGVFHTIPDSAGGSYEFTAKENGTHYAYFDNPSDGGGSVQIYVLTENRGPAIPGFNPFLIIALLGLFVLFIYRKTKPIPI